MDPNREYFVQLTKSLKAIEKAIGDASVAKTLGELVQRIEHITLAAKGDKGDDGITPVKGQDYDNGKDGVSIVNASINEDGELMLWYSDKREVNLGKVVGADGVSPTIDEEGLLQKLLERIVIPKVDEKKIAKAAAALVQVPKIPEAKPVSFKDLEDKPDFDKAIAKAVAGQLYEKMQEKGVYTGPVHAAGIVVKDEGVVIAEEVNSIDFRGDNITVTDLGDGNLVVTVAGGSAMLETQEVTGVQEGNNVRIALSQLDHTFLAAQWFAQNGSILRNAAASGDGSYSSWEIDGTDILVYWANAGDLFMLNYTFN